MTAGILVFIVIALVIFIWISNRIIAASPFMLISYPAALVGMYLNLENRMSALFIPVFFFLFPLMFIFLELDAILKKEAHFSRFVKEKVTGTLVTTYTRNWKVKGAPALKVSLIRMLRDGVFPYLAYLYSFAFRKDTIPILVALTLAYAIFFVILSVLKRPSSPVREFCLTNYFTLMCIYLTGISLLFGIPLSIDAIPLCLFFEPYSIIDIAGITEVTSAVQIIPLTTILPALVTAGVFFGVLCISGFIFLKRMDKKRTAVFLGILAAYVVNALVIWLFISNNAYKHTKFVLGHPEKYSANTILQSAEYTSEYVGVSLRETDPCSLFCYADRWVPRVDKIRAEAAIVHIVEITSNYSKCAVKCAKAWIPYVESEKGASIIRKAVSDYNFCEDALLHADAWMPVLKTKDLHSAIASICTGKPEAFIENLEWVHHVSTEKAVEKLIGLKLEVYASEHPDKISIAWKEALSNLETLHVVKTLTVVAAKWPDALLDCLQYPAGYLGAERLGELLSYIADSSPKSILGRTGNWSPLVQPSQATQIVESAIAKATPEAVLRYKSDWREFLDEKIADDIIKTARTAARQEGIYL